VLAWSIQAAAQLSDTDLEALRLQGQVLGWTFEIGETPATRLQAHALCGIRVPPDWRSRARFIEPTAKVDLPEQFDWRELGACTPVRNQHGCGGCWAFATIAPLESAILLKDGVEVDLSEQWLISCNTDGYNCDEGGWFAHEYHLDKPDACGHSGAVLEADCPYEADDMPCACPYPHVYHIDDWAYVGGEEDIPPIDHIKWAIMAFGPVAACLCTDATFGGYRGGIYNNNVLCEEVNHAVAIVGWDDIQGMNGVWIIRNSWGSSWGEGGYMRIEYGCSRIGFGACVVDYPGETPGDGPDILEQPSAGCVAAGLPYTFGIDAASDAGPIRYQWLRDGLVVTPQRSGPELYLTRVAPADEGVYTCVARDQRGASVSEPALLDVTENRVPGAGSAALVALSVLLTLLGALMAPRRTCRRG